MTANILIIEDDPALNQMLSLHFEDQGFGVFSAEQCAAGLQIAGSERVDVVLLDQQLPDGEGIALLPRLIEVQPAAGIIMMTGQHDLELAIQAIKIGAADFIHKPVKAATLQAAVDKVLAGDAAEPEHAVPVRDRPLGELIGRSDAMLAVSKQIALSAANVATVLITGESGTGKEIVARLIHQHSNRKGDFVAINCAAIVDTLLESELFGHEKGAFTGAERSKPGKFELAHDGTLFLDEIAELAPELQAKLLRALQERVIERVGGTENIRVNARIIAATHQDLFGLAAQGRFREDLAYRLNVIAIELPPLRERREDIPLLATGLLERAAARNDRATPAISQSALDALSAYGWPGNVRELENVLTQAMVMARDGQIADRHIRLRRAPGQKPTPGEPEPSQEFHLQSLDEIEAAHIQRVLLHTGGHKGKSCDILGISRPALDRKIHKYGLTLPDRD